MVNKLFFCLCMNTSDDKSLVMWNHQLKKDMVLSEGCLLSFVKEKQKNQGLQRVSRLVKMEPVKKQVPRKLSVREDQRDALRPIPHSLPSTYYENPLYK